MLYCLGNEASFMTAYKHPFNYKVDTDTLNMRCDNLCFVNPVLEIV